MLDYLEFINNDKKIHVASPNNNCFIHRTLVLNVLTA